MKRRPSPRAPLRAALAALLSALAASAVLAAPARHVPHVLHDAPRAPMPGEVLVADPGGVVELTPGGATRTRAAALAASLTQLGIDRGKVLWSAGKVRFLLLHSSDPAFDPVRAAAELTAAGGLIAAVPNLGMRLFDTIPNDPDLGLQWYVDDGGVADVRLPAAWDTQRGAASVRIGIMDTGVDLSHPDLAAQIWTNPGEIPGNGVDDDGDGYVDDVHGWDFGDGDNDPNPGAVIDTTDYGVDVGFHGTFVAGIADAATNNAEGIAGAGWNCKIVPLKVSNAAGDTPLSAVTEAFGWASAHHLEVLNMSFGAPDQPGVADYFQALVDEANAAGVLCVASAGNDGTNALNYPASCNGVLSVAATAEDNTLASFSSWGPTVRIAAPGSSMWSCLCQNYVIDDFSQLFYEVFFGWDGFNPYMYGDGTSFSAPLAAGVCALVRAEHPGWTPQQVMAQVIFSGDPVAFAEPVGTKLNAARAVGASVLAVTPASGALTLRGSPNPFAHRITADFSLAAAGPVRLRVFDCSGRMVRELLNGTLPAGAHQAQWDGRDARGLASAGGVYFLELELATGRQVCRVVHLR